MAKKVLIVDDSELILTMSRDALEKQGYEVYTAGSGIEANRIIFAPGKKPDLILLDIMMPMLNGDKVYEFFKRSELSRDIPVAIFSSKDEE
ncbi:MAG: response regulator, partial [Deltaproteobacteria bacterium]